MISPYLKSHKRSCESDVQDAKGQGKRSCETHLLFPMLSLELPTVTPNGSSWMPDAELEVPDCSERCERIRRACSRFERVR